MKMYTSPLVFVFLYLSGGVIGEQLQCKLPPHNVPTDWVTMVPPCITKMRDQVTKELEAAMTYMAMGAYFGQDTVNRPGFSKMFLESASEERQHAIKIIEYLVMRGELISSLSNLINNPKPRKTSWENGVEALTDALNLETEVTQSIMEIIKECEAPRTGEPVNDYHLVDYLTADFLEEQYQGQKDLANKISTLGKMLKNHGTLGEFLFDKKLLNGKLIS